MREKRKRAQVQPNAYELYRGNPAEYEQVLARIKKLPYPKRKRFTLDNLKDLDYFVSQQLNETRYIARQTVAFLGQLNGVSVQPVKGGTTALLRRVWGLNGILSTDGEKTREDHRHHAVDALVVALTDRRAVQQLNRYHVITEGRLQIKGYPVPIPELRQRAGESVAKIIVSHRPAAKYRARCTMSFSTASSARRTPRACRG